MTPYERLARYIAEAKGQNHDELLPYVTPIGNSIAAWKDDFRPRWKEYEPRARELLNISRTELRAFNRFISE